MKVYRSGNFLVVADAESARYYPNASLVMNSITDDGTISIVNNGGEVVLPMTLFSEFENEAGNALGANLTDTLTALSEIVNFSNPIEMVTGEVSTTNSTTTPLTNGATYTGTGVDVSSYPSVTVACLTDKTGTLQIQFSPDNTNWDSTLSFSVSANVNEVHRITVTRKYFRVRLTNTDVSTQTFLRLQSIFGAQQTLTSPLNGTVQTDADSLITRSVLMGQQDNGAYQYVPVTAEGHLEVAIHDPLLPFGSVHVENLTPIFQTDAVYGLNSGQVTTVASGSGTVTGDDNLFTCSTGTTVFSQAVLLGEKRLRYRAGQGIVGRFTALYTAPVANSYQLAGFGTASDGVYFGYGNTNDLSDTRFGILYVRGGVREVKTLTVTTKATTASNVTITLNGTNFTIPVTNATAGTLQQTVWDISQGTYAGWDAFPSGATVVFVRKSAGVTAGTQSFSAGTTGAVATIAQTKAGVASTDTFIPQSEWNGDVMDGTGASGVTIDPTKGNVFEIGIQYLGFGAIEFKIETAPTDSNNSQFVTVHTLKLPNTLTATNFTNPSFPFTMAAYSAGSTTNLTVKCASFAGFIEGQKVLHGNRFSYLNTLTTVGAVNLQALFTILNTRYYKGKASQVVVNLLSVMGAIKHTSPVIYYLVKNGQLQGNPNFLPVSDISATVYDTAATTVTYTNGDQLLWTGHLGDTGELDHHFGNGSYNAEEITLQPGEWITLAAKSTTGSPSYVTGSINTREDQ